MILSYYEILWDYNTRTPILWRYATSILWYYDTMRRYHGSMVWEEYDKSMRRVWHHDTVMPWYYATIINVIVWHYDILILCWRLWDTMRLWYSDAMLLWDYHNMRLWSYERVYKRINVWEYATMILRPCETMIRWCYEIMRRVWEEYKSRSLYFCDTVIRWYSDTNYVSLIFWN